ncbi:glutamyl-tRNA synthetase [Mycena metata]|uniref:glutamate--tRNA ligase n=1 Tax=Mycena metata TaxID=1033252 RepID=A0AAD7JBT8_9AGAR|nr:glutamyl-tRNA synthetase [Mycena metata]
MSTLSVPQENYPFACVALALSFNDIAVDVTAKDVTILTMDGSQVDGEANIIQAISARGNLASDGSRGQISFFKETASTLSATLDMQEIIKILGELDHHLAYRTFLVTHNISEADYALWGCLKGHSKAAGLLKAQGFAHFARWMGHLDSLPPFQRTITTLASAKASTLRANKSAAGFSLGLPNAIQGAVVTRFPPEPSGYLHIGHAKAIVLNQYFAKMYNGKFLIRFDDTNPSKEKVEFEETILEDLHLLNAVGENVTHTSDYFSQLHDYAVQLIESGKAYADDTDAMTPLEQVCSCPPKSHGKLSQMAHERFHGLPSSRRDSTKEENLLRFSEMNLGKLGEDGARWCLRAKVSVDNPNKALRDPVIYRCNSVPHHRTGDRWKVYPTYDFACPVVDSLEGVTHALRTNEYRDRNPQYHWMIEALGLRRVEIWDFSRLNFIYTVLSKRKLQQFVHKGLVRGWDDPRFPTVRGIIRRGLTIEALQQFMLQQGPSQAVLSLEWDSIWALNKKIIDPKAPRFCAILKDNCVPVHVRNGPSESYSKLLPKHKKNSEIGQKLTTYSSDLTIEQVDAASFDLGEEITLMDWGNAIVRSKTLAEDGRVSSITVDLHLEGDFKATKKKITWLAQSPDRPLVEVTLLDYDYIITKKKLEDGDSWEDFVTPRTEFREEAVADANVLDLMREGEESGIMQFERKGFYRLDGDAGGRLEFIRIPDGRAAGLASKA